MPGDVNETKSAMLVLEDIHWADDESPGSIEHIAAHCRDAPLVIFASPDGSCWSVVRPGAGIARGTS
jgi:predicted ATPase